MADIYCGIDDVPKGKRRGSMRECAEKKQVRYYGKYKVDNIALEAAKNKDVIPETREKLLLELAALRGSIRRHKGRCETSKNKDIKEESCKIWKKSEDRLKKIIPKLQKVEKAREAKKVKKSIKKPVEYEGEDFSKMKKIFKKKVPKMKKLFKDSTKLPFVKFGEDQIKIFDKDLPVSSLSEKPKSKTKKVVKGIDSDVFKSIVDQAKTKRFTWFAIDPLQNVESITSGVNGEETKKKVEEKIFGEPEFKKRGSSILEVELSIDTKKAGGPVSYKFKEYSVGKKWDLKDKKGLKVKQAWFTVEDIENNMFREVSIHPLIQEIKSLKEKPTAKYVRAVDLMADIFKELAANRRSRK